MRETPSNEFVAAIAKLLREGKVKLNELSAIPGLLAEKGSLLHGKLGDLTVGEAPNEVQNWAEGNLPLELQPGTGLPRFKSDKEGSRAGATLDALSTLPIGTALKGGGIAAGQAALYARALRPELIASHSAYTGSLMKNGKLPLELYNPSFGIKDSELMTEFGNTKLIPKLGYGDPKTTPSVLTIRDSFSPRHDAAAGQRVDEIRDRFIEAQRAGNQIEMERLARALRSQAGSRLADKFVPGFEKGGLGGEGNTSKALTLPQYGSGGLGPRINLPGRNVGDYDPVLKSSKRFQNFQDFETSPVGARLLTDENPMEVSDRIKERAQSFLQNIKRKTEDGRLVEALPTNDQEWFDSLRDIANMEPHKDWFIHKDMPVNFKGMQENARNLLRHLKMVPSEYGELKTYGPVQLNRENIAGIVAPANEALSRGLRKQAEARGIPVHMSLGNMAEDVQAAQDFQNTGRTMVPGATMPGKVTPYSQIPVGETKDLTQELMAGMPQDPAITQMVDALKQGNPSWLAPKTPKPMANIVLDKIAKGAKLIDLNLEEQIWLIDKLPDHPLFGTHSKDFPDVPF